jgi:hypothetical protein
VERLLTAFKVEPTMQASEGFEARLLARLQAQGRSRRDAFVRAWLRGWAPAALAASLICVFAGGLMVERETAMQQQSQRQQSGVVPQVAGSMPEVTGSMLAAGKSSAAATPQSEAAVPGDVRPGLNGLRTASARLRPTVPVPVGRRHGRASAGERSSSR